MKVLINTIFSFILLGLASCQVEEVTTTPKAIAEGSKSITTSVKMIRLEGGKYKPFFGTDTSIVQVEPFYIDERPVTNGEFLEFVKAYPEWRRSNVKRIYADSNYLKIWESDTSLPDSISKDAPITQVSWHAAKAYASAVGKRLPLLDEWEFVAMADQNSANARDKKSYSDDIIDLYLIKNRQFNPVKQSPPNYWGIYNMFDLVWEWTDDFNSILITGDSRSGEYGDKNMFCAGGATSATDIMNYAAFMRFSMRAGLKANYTVNNLGFRCAKDYSANKN